MNYLICVAAYLILSLCLGNSFDYLNLIKSFFISGSYMANGWYLQTLTLFYLAFFLVFLIPMKDKNKIVTIFSFVIAYSVAGFFLEQCGLGHYGVGSGIFFPIGMAYAYKKKAIVSWLRGHKAWAFVIAGFSLISAGILLILRKKVFPYAWLIDLAGVYVAMGFAFGVLLLLTFANLNCRFTRFLGKYSYEIYVMQGLGFILASAPQLGITNLYLQLLLSAVITAFLCFPFHFLFNLVRNACRREKPEETK